MRRDYIAPAASMAYNDVYHNIISKKQADGGKGEVKMKLTFLGATHEVTGSCTLIEVNGKYGLVDCGMEQGKDIFENQEISVDASAIDYILLTHAHIDHSGNIPLLYKKGFRGSIYATRSTSDLCAIMLRDSAHIQEFEAEWRNRKAKRADAEPYVPLYTMADAEGALSKFRPCPYGNVIRIADGVEIRFTDIGHLLGSSCIEVFMTEGDVSKKVVFSGDVGNTNQPIIRDPSTVEEADFVVCESTYGDRLHEKFRAEADHVGILAECIQRTFDRGGNVVIPSFAVGRTQEMLYFIREIKERELVKGHGNFPVYTDSPLANEATGIFVQCDRVCLDDEAAALLDRGVNPLMFPGLKTSVTAEDSKAINLDETPKVIISASGMCEAGRIKHHLKHNLWRADSTILFVGYQAVGTLGRSIADGAKKVKLFGEEIAVNAEVAFMPGVSGHADMDGLLDWIAGFKTTPKLIFVNHGENEVCDSFVNTLEERGYRAFAPYSGTVYDLKEEAFIECPEGVPVIKETKGAARATAVYDKLLSTADRLYRVAELTKGMSNKDLAKFTSQIEALITKWQK